MIGSDLLRFSDRKKYVSDNLTCQGNGVTKGMTPDHIQAIVSDYQNGAHINQLAAKYHHRNTIIRRVLVANGVRILGMGEGARKHTLNETYFDKIDTPEKAYILGFIYADGCVYLPAKRPKEGAFMLNLQKRDIEMFKLIQSAIESSHPLFDDAKCGNGAYRLIIGNRRFCDSLIRAGVTPRKSLTLEFPSEAIVPKALRRYFILGYFDGDGSICHNDEKGFWSFSLLGTEQFLSAILAEFQKVVPDFKKRALLKHWKTAGLFKISLGGRHLGSYIRSRTIWYIWQYFYEGHAMGLKRKRDRMDRIAPHYTP